MVQQGSGLRWFTISYQGLAGFRFRMVYNQLPWFSRVQVQDGLRSVTMVQKGSGLGWLYYHLPWFSRVQVQDGYTITYHGLVGFSFRMVYDQMVQQGQGLVWFTISYQGLVGFRFRMVYDHLTWFRRVQGQDGYTITYHGLVGLVLGWFTIRWFSRVKVQYGLRSVTRVQQGSGLGWFVINYHGLVGFRFKMVYDQLPWFRRVQV